MSNALGKVKAGHVAVPPMDSHVTRIRGALIVFPSKNASELKVLRNSQSLGNKTSTHTFNAHAYSGPKNNMHVRV